MTLPVAFNDYSVVIKEENPLGEPLLRIAVVAMNGRKTGYLNIKSFANFPLSKIDIALRMAPMAAPIALLRSAAVT